MELFCMYDKKAGQYFGIALHKNEALYLRSLSPLFKSTVPDNLLYHHSSDFECYKLGTFDEKSGLIVPEVTFIANVSDLIRSLEETNA